MNFKVDFFDDSRVQCYFSISARDEADARRQVNRLLSGRRGSGVMREVIQCDGTERAGEAIPFQLISNRQRRMR